MSNKTNTSTTKFKVDISELKAGIQEANRQIKLANAQFKAVSSAMDNWEKSTDGLKAKLTQLDTVLTGQKTKLENLEKQLKLVEEAEGENSKGATNLKISIENQKAVINATEKDIAKYTEALEEFERSESVAEYSTDELAESIEEVGDSAKNSSDGFTIFKGVLADLISNGISKAISAVKGFVTDTIEVGKAFDASMSKVKAISGATGDELEALRDKAKDLGASTVFTASEAADAFSYMAMAGWETEDMLSGIDGILNLAAASGADLATTSDIVTDALTAMGYASGEAGRLADVMAAASSNANTNVELMGATFQYAAPIAGALGYSMEDVATATGLMANAGIKGEKAGTALRSIMTRLSAPTDDARMAMEDLGLTITNSDGTMKSLNDVMEDLRSAFNGLGEAEQAEYAKMLAGQNAMSGLLAITNSTEKDFNKLTNAVNDCNGAAEEMAKTAQDNLAGDLTQLGSKIESVQLAIYEKFEPAMRTGVEILGKLADGLFFLVDHSQEVLLVLGSIASGVGAYIAYTTALKVMKEGWTALTVVTKAQAVAQKLLNAVMSVNPIGLIIAAVTALIAIFISLWNTSEDFRNFWINLWDNIKKVVKAVVDWFGEAVQAVADFFSGMWEGLENGAKAAWEGIKKTFSAVADFFGNIFSSAWKKVKDIFSTGGKIFSGIKDGIVNAFKTVVNAIIKGINKVISIPFNVINGVLNKIRKIGILDIKPFENLWGENPLKVPQIPQLYNGAVAEKGRMYLLEGKGTEAVVPLENNKKWIGKTSKDLKKSLENEGVINGVNSSKNVTNNYNFTQNNTSPKSLSRLEIYRQTKNQLNFAKGV